VLWHHSPPRSVRRGPTRPGAMLSRSSAADWRKHSIRRLEQLTVLAESCVSARLIVSCRHWQHIFILQNLFGDVMLIEHDQTTLANMTAALDSVCKKISADRDCSELRKKIADAMIEVARDGRRTFLDFQTAGLKVLSEALPRRGRGGLPGLQAARHVAKVIRAKFRG
jgi:hypothetical protein